MVLLKEIRRKLHILAIMTLLVLCIFGVSGCSGTSKSGSSSAGSSALAGSSTASDAAGSLAADSSAADSSASDNEAADSAAADNEAADSAASDNEVVDSSAADSSAADSAAADTSDSESKAKKNKNILITADGKKVNFKKTYTRKQLIKLGYPKSLAKLYVRNSEARRFVLNYLSDDIHDYDYENVVNDEVTKGTIPHFLQWDSRWGYEMYGDDFMAVNGCGPTALAMVYCGLTGDGSINPYILAKYAEEKGYYVDGQGTSWSMMDKMAEKIGLTVHTVDFDADSIKKELKKGRPIIAIMGPGDFTDNGHFIVLYKVTKNGKIRIRDPFSKANTKKAWDIDTLMYQMQSLWSYSYK